MDIKKILVVGAGVMGHGVALVAARSGFDVSMVDIKDEFVRRGMAGITGFLEAGLKRGKILQEEVDATLSHIRTSTDVDGEAANTNFVFEAIIENMKIKSELFARLNAVCKPEVIFASNTSQLSITELGEASGRPELLIGMHWFNPPP